MTPYRLTKYEVEDISEIFFLIEESFDIILRDDEWEPIKNWGEVCDLIISKMQLEDVNDCTSQQAFYKLRNAIALVLKKDVKSIVPETLLIDLFPKKNREDKLKEIENLLGFKLPILGAPQVVVSCLVFIMFFSFPVLFFYPSYGFSGLVFASLGIWIANKTGKKFYVDTVKQLVEMITAENYLKSRRNKNTFNRNEIEKIITDWVIKTTAIDKFKLTRDTTF